MGHAEVGVDLGRGKGRLEAGHDHSVDHRGVDVPLDHQLSAHVGDRQTHRLVALGGAVDQEPGPLGPPGFGRQLLCFLEGVRIADVDALDQGRNVVRQAGLPDQQVEPVIGSDAALMAGNVEPPGVALGELEQGIDIGGAVLTGRHGPSLLGRIAVSEGRLRPHGSPVESRPQEPEPHSRGAGCSLRDGSRSPAAEEIPRKTSHGTPSSLTRMRSAPSTRRTRMRWKPSSTKPFRAATSRLLPSTSRIRPLK